MPNVNIALNLFGIIVMLILFFSCLGERLKRESSSNSILFMMCSIVCALTADTFAWIAEGRLGFSLMSVIANTASFCACYAVIFFFLLYMSENLLQKEQKKNRSACRFSPALRAFNAHCYGACFSRHLL